MWERGVADPHPDYIITLCNFFGKNPADLDLAKELTEDELRMIQEILKNRKVDRRQALVIAALPAFAGIDWSELSNPLVSPDIFLSQCSAAINVCWHLMGHDGLAYVNEILKAYLPILTRMADSPSDYQHLAASLAVEAKSLEVLLAMHRRDHMEYEICSASAVRFGRLAGNNRKLATTLSIQGRVYTFHLPNAKRAIPLFKDGLELLDRDALLNKADLSSGLAYAYALQGQERKAIEMIEQSRTAMPKYPERDPLYRLIDFGLADLDRIEGRVYLCLAEKRSNSEYAEKAYNAFAQGTSKQATSSRSRSQTLILQAEAALALGDFREFVQCLEQGLSIALQIASERRKHEAHVVLVKAPDMWKKEDRYEELVKMF